jgi:hypothetical protein
MVAEAQKTISIRLTLRGCNNVFIAVLFQLYDGAKTRKHTIENDRAECPDMA